MKESIRKKGIHLIIISLVIIVGMGMFTELQEFISSTGEIIAGVDSAPVVNAQQFRGTEPGMRKIVEAHWQGMEAVPLTWEIAAKLGIPLDEKGVLVDEVTLSAAESGLWAGDVIKSINGMPVTNLEEFYLTTKRVRNHKSVSINARRRSGKRVIVNLTAADQLGFAQLESAPMILPGSIPPHRYRGGCTDCHSIGTTGELNPDPGMVTLSPPPISKKTRSPHRNRGKCKGCHFVR